jgi:two-component system CheB/CheR fusion protein
VVHLAHRSLGAALRDAIDAALNGEDRRVVHELTSSPESPGEPRYFEVCSFIKVARTDRVPEQSESIVLLISDVTSRQREQRARQAELEEAQARAARLQQLLDESTRTVRQLLQANQDLSSTNTELRSTNEELLVGNEETQAAMEEIETLNEEQQATNEELETLNEELQATVEELNATNEDLQARSVELQEQAVEREALVASVAQEQKRLAAILASMSDAVILVDANAEPILTNAAFQQLFGATLPALEDASGQRLPPKNSPHRRAARGETFTQHFTIPGENGNRRWFEATGQPIQIDTGREGGVVVIRDVSDRSLRQLQEQFVALAGHELRTPLTALRGSIQLLERALREDPAGVRARRYVSIGLEQTRFLGELIQSMSSKSCKPQSSSLDRWPRLMTYESRYPTAPLWSRATSAACSRWC